VSLFSVNTKEQLAFLLKVLPVEIDEVLADRRKYLRSFRISKPNGASRLVYDPQGPLKLLQQKIKTHILDSVPLPNCVHGGVRCRSVLTNAAPHVGKEFVFCLDIKDFFPGIGPTLVGTIFRALGFGPGVVDSLVSATTWDNHLPQGLATSTGLANLAMARVDLRLQTLACKQSFDYTRWIDDLTLSGRRRLLNFERLILRIVAEGGFSVNPDKVQMMHSGMQQVVTGVVVNRKLNVPRAERNRIRREVLQFRASKHDSEATFQRIRGKVSWISQVNPSLGARLETRLSR